MASGMAMTSIMSMEHSYTQSQDHSEKMPSFLILQDHPYISTVKVCTKKRPRGTPTGKTPIQLSKRQPKPSSRWSENEREFLASYVGDTQGPTSNEFWRNCARAMNEKLGSNRTGASCKSFYRRFALEVEPINTCTADDTDDMLAEPLVSSNDVMCQTDLSLPIGRESPSESHTCTSIMSDDEENILDTLDDRRKMIFYLKKSFSTKSQLENKQFFLFSDELETHLLYEIIKLIITNCKSVDICKAIMNVKSFKKCLWDLFMDEIAESAKYLCQKRRSYLSNIDFDGLRYFNWESIIEEMFVHQNKLLQVLVTMATNDRKAESSEHYSDISKELGLIYGILMKRRCNSLSRVQRVVSITLAEECVHQKVYDRLQPLGVTSSHCVMLRVQKKIGGHFSTQLIDAVTCGKKFRIVGDNVNFMVDVSQQHKGLKPHMEHWFASSAIIQHGDFSSLSDIRPHIPLLNLDPTYFIPQENDWQTIKMSYILIVLEILCKFCTYFIHFKFVLDKLLKEMKPVDYDISEVHTTVPLPVLPKNEQKYSDVIQILDQYETIVQNVHGKNANVCVHIGGDQLTRERFSGAKRLRAASVTSSDRFEHLSPITFEFFHLQMSILTMFYKLLYRKNGKDLGTLHSEKVNLGRTKVNGEDVKNHYNDCKDLADSLISAYVVEAVMHFFGMQSHNAQPGKHFATFDVSSSTNEQKEDIILKALGEFVSSYILNEAKAYLKEDTMTQNTQNNRINIVLPNGTTLQLNIPISTATCRPVTLNRDSVLCYGKTVLEIGLLFRCVNLNIKIPNRDKMISVMKYCMCIMKGHNNQSKYALEILRFLFLQLAVLDTRTACETFYGLFVNKRGKTDSSFPADLHMEHMVKEIKHHLKSLHSNKSESSVQARSAAFAGMKEISEKFDKTTDVVFRAKRHNLSSSHDDELSILHRLSRVKPFKEIVGRSLESYPSPISSPLKHLKLVHFKGWIRDHQYEILSDLGI